MNEVIFFYSFAGLTLLAALYVVLTKNPTYAVLSLVAAMFSLAILFVLLHAYFIAVVHVLVYAGAILVLFLFVLIAYCHKLLWQLAHYISRSVSPFLILKAFHFHRQL